MPTTGKSTTGFTLPEALIASALSLMVVAMVMTLLIKNLVLWREGMTRLHLDEQSRIVRERVLHGIGGRFGLRHAYRSQITSTTDQIVFFDVANSKALSLLWPSNLPPMYIDHTGAQPMAAAGVFVESFTANMTGNVMHIDLSLGIAAGNRIHTQPQQIRVYLLNE